MPELLNPRHEAFARARARGALLDDAYEAAGYAPARGHSSRLAKRPLVAARVAELRSQLSDWESANGQSVVAALLRMAERCDYFDTPERMRETRLTLIEARKLQKEVAQERRDELAGRLARPKRRKAPATGQPAAARKPPKAAPGGPAKAQPTP